MNQAESLGFIEAGLAARRVRERRIRLLTMTVPAAVTLGWVVFSTVGGHWARIASNWEAALTMVFGSFVAGSTPQGGGAVAFPVFTKLLELPAELARTFSLSIQAIGMVSAATAILIARRPVEWKVLLASVPGALVGFWVALGPLGNDSVPFLPSTLPGAYVKVSFTLIVGAMALITFLGSRVPIRQVRVSAPDFNVRIGVVVVGFSFLGGLASGLTGSGADVMLYLVLVVLLAVDPKVGVPTSVVLMAMISVAGLLVLGVGEGHLDTMLDASGTEVTAVAGREVAIVGERLAFGSGTHPEADGADLFGLWLAAVPVVAWGAPLGSLVASRMSARALVRFVLVLAVAEIITTAIFLDELRRDPGLLAFALVGAVVVGGGLALLAANRNRILRLPAIDLDRSVTRRDLDLRNDYREALSPDDDRRTGE